MGQSIYARGQIALGSGDLLEVTNIKIDTTNNAKQVHTIRRKGAGTTLGVEESSVSFDAVIPETGEEADWYKLVKKGTYKQLRIKIPNRTINVVGIFKDVGIELPLDDAIKATIMFIGHVDD